MLNCFHDSTPKPPSVHMRLHRNGILAVVLSTVLSVGCADEPSAPQALTPSTPRLSEESGGGGCPPGAYICDGWYYEDDGFEEVFDDVTHGEGGWEEYSSSQGLQCPSYIFGLSQITLNVPTPDGSTRSATIRTYGTWSWRQAIAPMEALYNWPPGYWPTVDGSGAEVSISYAQGRCLVYPGNVVRVALGPNFYHVNTRYPRRRGYQPTSGGGGGGGSGGESGCDQEYVYVEVNRGDGAGWQVIWEGWATVCG